MRNPENMQVEHLASYKLPISIENDTEIFCFSDTHAMANVFNSTVHFIGDTERSAKKRIVISMGDIIDRGVASGYLAARGAFVNRGDIYAPAKADEVIELFGNHEQLMLTSFGILHPTESEIIEYSKHHTILKDAARHRWYVNGGNIQEQNIMDIARRYRTWNRNKKIMQTWMNEMKTHYISGNMLFVHAGINPNQSIEENFKQPVTMDFSVKTKEDFANHWAWIRDPFLNEKNILDKTGYFIMHGHTPIDATHDEIKTMVKMGRLNHDVKTWISEKQRVSHIVENKLDIFDIHPL